MRTGVSYQPSINPRHLRSDLEEIRDLGCSDLLLAFQENDYVYLRGKIEFVPPIAHELGLRTIGIFWGGLNLFGGGRSAHFLLWHPEAHQVARDGGWRASGCYNHPVCIERVHTMIAHIAELGYQGYFVDEPSQEDCYCDACAELFREWYGGDLRKAPEDELPAFRQRCVSHYLRHITDHVKARHPQLETHCCLMPVDRDCWAEAATLPSLDSLGTDLYWANDNQDLELMREPVRSMADLCREHGKMHQEWFQCWGIERGNEERAAAQGRILIEERPDAIYTWAYNGQLGTSETCEDPERAWKLAAEVLRDASALSDQAVS